MQNLYIIAPCDNVFIKVIKLNKVFFFSYKYITLILENQEYSELNILFQYI